MIPQLILLILAFCGEGLELLISPHFYLTPIKDNIGYGLNNLTMDQIEHAANQSQATEFIEKHLRVLIQWSVKGANAFRWSAATYCNCKDGYKKS